MVAWLICTFDRSIHRYAHRKLRPEEIFWPRGQKLRAKGSEWDIEGKLEETRRSIDHLLSAIPSELQCWLTQMRDPGAMFTAMSRIN